MEDNHNTPKTARLTFRGNKGLNAIRLMNAEGRAMNLPGQIISLGIGAPHLVESPLIDITQKEFLAQKDKLVEKLNSSADASERLSATRSLVALETYYPANGAEECQAVCAALVNQWYPGLQADAEHMIVTNGCTQALMCVMHTFVEPGVGVCAFVPYFPPYVSQTVMFGGQFIGIPTVNCRPVKEANPQIGLLIFNDPVNPSGVKFSREELLEIGSVLDLPEYRHIFILIDDTYHELCYGESPAHFLNVCGVDKFRHRVAIAGCLSKCMGGAPGLRAGFLYACDYTSEGRTVNIAKRSEIAMLNSSCALSVIIAYTLQELLKAKLKLGRSEEEQKKQLEWEAASSTVYAGLLDVVIRKFNADSHFPLVVRPEAAFFSMVQCSKLIGRKVLDEVTQLNGTVIKGLRQYVKNDTFLTDFDVAIYLLRAAYVILVPASDFGLDGTQGYLRITCTLSPKDLEEAFDRIEYVAKQITASSQ